METLPFRLIDEPIEVKFATEPLYEKKPVCPISFNWHGVEYPIEESLRNGRITAARENGTQYGPWTFELGVAQRFLGGGAVLFSHKGAAGQPL